MREEAGEGREEGGGRREKGNHEEGIEEKRKSPRREHPK